MAVTVGTRRSVFLDLVRLEMASFVIISHSFGFYTGFEPGVFGASLGGWALRGFFVLSGWLVVASWRSDPHLLRFAVRRFARIAPGFWVAFAASLALGAAFGGRAVGNLWADAALLAPPEMAAFGGSNTNVNGAMWSIDWEIFCYAATPVLAMFLRGRTRLVLLAAVVLVAVLSRGVGKVSDVIAPYCLGAILAGSPIRLPDLRLNVPDISYGTYLYGFPIQMALKALGVPNPILLIAMALPLAMLCGWVSHVFVERPAILLAKAWAGRHRATEAERRPVLTPAN